jgi:hypothetical protein
MNLMGAMLWMMIATTAGPEAQAVPPAPSPRSIEIVIAGPDPGRHEMEEALRSLLGADADVAWSTRDAFPSEVLSSAPRPDCIRQIWIDVADVSRVRIVVPACEPADATLVRTIEAPSPAPGHAGHASVVRETAAQIVGASVLAMQGGEAALLHPVVSPEPTLAPAITVTDNSRKSEPAEASGVPSGRGFSLALAAGAHTSPFTLAEPHDEYHWLGFSMVLSGRWETPRFLLAVRTAAEFSERSIDTIDLRSQLYSATLAASRKLSVGSFAFSLGLEAGALILRQHTSLIWDSYSGGTYTDETALSLPGRLGTTWSVGPMFGPIGEARVTVSRRIFLHLARGRARQPSPTFCGIARWNQDRFRRQPEHLPQGHFAIADHRLEIAGLPRHARTLASDLRAGDAVAPTGI